MPDAVNNDGVTFDFEQNTIVPHPQAILWSEIRQLLNATGQTFSHLLDLLDNPPSEFGWQLLQVFYGPRLEAEIIFHFSLPSTPNTATIGAPKAVTATARKIACLILLRRRTLITFVLVNLTPTTILRDQPRILQYGRPRPVIVGQ